MKVRYYTVLTYYNAEVSLFLCSNVRGYNFDIRNKNNQTSIIDVYVCRLQLYLKKITIFFLDNCKYALLDNDKSKAGETIPAGPRLKWSTSKHKTVTKTQYTHIHTYIHASKFEKQKKEYNNSSLQTILQPSHQLQQILEIC